jgi:hypothetical protein
MEIYTQNIISDLPNYGYKWMKPSNINPWLNTTGCTVVNVISNEEPAYESVTASYMWNLTGEGNFIPENDLSISMQTLYTIQSISLLFKVENENEISPFLLRNKEIIEDVLHSYAAIREYFGGLPISLKLITDYEDTSWETLKMSIEGTVNYSESIENLNRLFEEWLINQGDSFKRLVTIGLL